jgi:hypothetical protein
VGNFVRLGQRFFGPELDHAESWAPPTPYPAYEMDQR